MTGKPGMISLSDNASAATVAEFATAANTLPKRFLVALDASDHANRALAEVLRLTAPSGGSVTGIHAYAARLHDRRFKQMEGGLPERYQRESEMEHQREVHEDLIGMGLGLISDSYHDAAEAVCDKAGVPFRRLSPEGKNYACLLEELKGGKYDVLALGALGLGAVAGSTIGTVCERIVRRSPIDVFVAKALSRPNGDGPIVVGMDGSPKSFGALKTAIGIGRQLNVAVHVVAAYDPYFHYVAFNRISTVLGEEAGKVFRFKEQEQLHEELIDDGIAKIYQAHLNVAVTVAAAEDFEITTALLPGKPYQAIGKYIDLHNASLLVVGKTGVHADDGLDIGGNTENLLRIVPCHVWIGQVTFIPPADVVAEETILWSTEAEEKINRAPDFVRGIAHTAVIRQAQAEGHTFITTRFVDQVMKAMMPGDAGRESATGIQQAFERLAWSDNARALVESLADPLVRKNIALRAEKSARRDASTLVRPEHVEPFLADAAEPREPVTEITWRAAPLARLQRIPEAFRDRVRISVEAFARARGATVIEGNIAEAAFASAREGMCPVDHEKGPA
ncbi:MAG: universal stress protein [Fimbriimonadaceae bacterium]|nr:universal stress protein [Alphaproteobacteria bacterium]